MRFVGRNRRSYFQFKNAWTEITGFPRRKQRLKNSKFFNSTGGLPRTQVPKYQTCKRKRELFWQDSFEDLHLSPHSSSLNWSIEATNSYARNHLWSRSRGWPGLLRGFGFSTWSALKLSTECPESWCSFRTSWPPRWRSTRKISRIRTTEASWSILCSNFWNITLRLLKREKEDMRTSLYLKVFYSFL